MIKLTYPLEVYKRKRKAKKKDRSEAWREQGWERMQERKG